MLCVFRLDGLTGRWHPGRWWSGRRACPGPARAYWPGVAGMICPASMSSRGRMAG